MRSRGLLRLCCRALPHSAVPCAKTPYLARMRWEELFNDLETDAEGLALRDRDAEIAERTRAELAAIGVLDRLRAGVGDAVILQVLGVGRLEGRLRRLTPTWLLLDADGRHGWAVSVDALTGVEGLTSAAAPGESARSVATRTTWSSAFRVLSRDRELVVVYRVDGTSVRGLPARVGRDFVEMWRLDEETPGPPPARAARRSTVVPFRAVAAVALQTGAA